MNFESFDWILLNSKFICIIGTFPIYLGKWEKRMNFGNSVAEIQQKYEREREKVGERKFWISVITHVSQTSCPCLKKKPIVAMPLPK